MVLIKKTMKKIVILFNLNRHKFEYESEFDSEATIQSIFNSLKENFNVLKIEADQQFHWINRLVKFNPSLVFNICEGFRGPARESVYAGILEQLGYNYSGPDSTNLLVCHNKYLVKNLLKDCIDVPNGYSICHKSDLAKLNDIKYPVIVKLNSEGSSIGITSKSIVYNFQNLEKQVSCLLNRYKANVLVEKYIEGEDLSMVYVEGLGALGPCQVTCDAKVYDYEMKTTRDEDVSIKSLHGDYVELKNIVNIIAERLDLKGYAKIDFRVQSGAFYLIEVNSQVSFHPDGEFITCAKRDGYDFNHIINYIVERALKFKRKKNSIGLYNVNG